MFHTIAPGAGILFLYAKSGEEVCISMDNPKVKRVLMSVTDKTGVVEFARALHDEFGAEIISTGGTARAIAEGGVPVTPID